MANEPNIPRHPYYAGENHFKSPKEAQTQYFIDPTKIPGYDTTGPERLTDPTYSPPAPILIGTAYSFVAGTYAATGGGTVNVVTRWIVGGVPQTSPYTPVAGDDLQSMILEEVATETGGTNDGETVYSRRVGTVTYPAPTLDSQPADISYEEDTGWQGYAMAPFFTGDNLTWSVTFAAGIFIDQNTGEVSVDTSVASGTSPVTVVASNSGGSANASYDIIITEAGVGPVISNLVIQTDGDLSFETDVGAGTAYVVFSDDPNPSTADIIAGVGDVADSWAITVAGGNSGSIDLTAIAGQTKYCSVCHLSGSPSNVLTGSVDVDSVDTAPVITGVPTISGVETVGEVLTATPASVTGVPTPTRTWQWVNSASGDIAGAISNTYTLQASDEGDTITVRQIETNVVDSDNATSAPTGVIAAASSGLAVSGTTGSPTYTGSVSEGGKTWDVYEFTASGSITFTGSGTLEDLLAGGGGGGGSTDGTFSAGGGGGGEVLIGSQAISAGTLDITVGDGGAVDTNGGASSVSGLFSASAAGGGSGGEGGVASPASDGGSGGSGGGGGSDNTASAGVGGAAGSGNASAGGDGFDNATSTTGAGGGGGGAGAAGQNAASQNGGDGGDGITSVINAAGAAAYYGGGGGGSTNHVTVGYGVGGQGGGGDGALRTNTATAGTANTGGGGGGAPRGGTAGVGGSGIVAVRFEV